MRSILLTFFVAVTSICFSQATSDDWIYVTSNSDSIHTIHVRKTYVSKENIIKVWLKTKSQSIKVGKKTYQNVELKNLYVIDCSNQRFKIISYLINDSKGKLLDSLDKEEVLVDWTNVAPETVGETIINEVCSLFM